MKILVVGNGGREHALCWKLAQSQSVSKIFCAPGNGGTAQEQKTKNLNIGVNDFDSLSEFANTNEIDLIVIGPDNPLADGITDYLEKSGHTVFGPTKEQAKLEWSKVHAKETMRRLSLPTADFEVFDNKEKALEYAKSNDLARVVKVDGLALGKGVMVCDSIDDVEQALASIFDRKAFGDAGQKIIIEQKLTGEELSILCLCDGKTLKAMPACQDHKRRFDGDKGPNTGGMGAYTPVPLYDKYKKQIDEQVLAPINRALSEGTLSFKGVLFIGILIADDIPYLLEFNARFGDPETQAVLPRLKSCLAKALKACTDGTLDKINLEWDDGASLCVVAVGKAYPESSSKGEKITVGDLQNKDKVQLFHAGTIFKDNTVTTNGGRVMGMTGLGKNLSEASSNAYKALESVSFKDMDYRKDIGAKAMRSLAQ
jgi:phosphoribosylamine--glycine ligase